MGLFRQAIVAGKVAMITEEEDCAVVIDPGLLQRVAYFGELGIHLGAHSQVNCPQFIPFRFRVILHMLEFPQPLFHQRLSRTFLRLDPGRQFASVNRGIERLFHSVRCMRIHEPQEDAQGLIVHRMQNAFNGRVHRFIIPGVIAVIFI